MLEVLNSLLNWVDLFPELPSQDELVVPFCSVELNLPILSPSDEVLVYSTIVTGVYRVNYYTEFLVNYENPYKGPYSVV